jgi:membrane protein implicated in regulation of membrane protease activity
MLLGLYTFTAIVGWTLVGLMAVFGGDSGFDADTDLGMSLDSDLNLKVDGPSGLDIGDASTAFGSFGEVLLGMLSVRSMLFFAAGFGGAGLLATWLTGTSIGALPFAAAAGFLGSYVNSALMKWMRGSELDSQLQSSDISGSRGEVVVPVGPGQKGRIAVQIKDRPIMMLADVYSKKDSDQLKVGERILVVEVDDNGTALITRLNDLSQS